MVAYLPFVSFAQARKQTRSVDIQSFDVGGVKIGMSFDEARTAMAKNFDVPVSEIRASALGDLEVAIIGKKLPHILVYENNGIRMQTNLTPRLPLDKDRPLAVVSVTYEIPWTKQNEIEMEKAARAKFGPPSDGSNLRWCEEPYPNVGMGCLANKAEISVGGTKIRMNDPSWSIAVRKFLDDQKAAKPKF
jgi:hypothetical protein